MSASAPQDAREYSILAGSRLEKIRENLLNFSRNNPLVNTRLDGRTSRYLRVVDEMPQVLYGNLTGGQPMDFTPLPEIPDPPVDEQSEHFRQALRDARESDEQYMADLQQFEKTRAAGRRPRKDPERALKDRVRERLGLPKRVNPLNPSLVELRRHATAHGIEPGFELPRASEAHADGRHSDHEIQTLALPEQMRRNLEKVYDDDRTAQQEAGINSLYCAFGFLEWTDPAKADNTAVSPLILLPVALRFDRRAQRYSAFGTSERGELNLVLAEKLRRELNIELPTEFDSDVEAYFASVAAAAPPTIKPTLHRYVAFGTFNSTQVAVFNDLDPHNWRLDEGPALELLISSAGASQSGGFTTEYPVDSPEFRKIAPLLIADADSSQVSTIIDTGRGKNFALEGPPGSGKSQTIVNTIAAALDKGQKVLFVAQKTAALEVVRARLTERGLTDFLLTLQAGRSERQAFREQIRSRMESRVIPDSGEYQTHRDEFHRHRERLQAYLDTLATPCGRTGRTVHEVLSEAVASAESFRVAADDLPDSCFGPTAGFDAAGIIAITEAAASFERALLSADVESRWSGVTVGPLDRSAVDAYLRACKKAAEHYQTASAEQRRLAAAGVDSDYLAAVDLAESADRMRRLANLGDRIDRNLVATAIRDRLGRALRDLLIECERAAEERSALSAEVSAPPSAELSERLRASGAAAARLGLSNFDTDAHRARRAAQADLVEAGRFSLELIDLLRAEAVWIDEVTCGDLVAAAETLGNDRVSLLRLRNPSNTAESGWERLRAAITRIDSLRAERERLLAYFRLDRRIDPETAHDAARILETTGAIGKLAGTYRTAKKHYRGLAVAPKPFESSEAATRLERLAQWQDQVDALLGDQFLVSLFGPGFTGLDTQLDPYRNLTDYLCEVESRFSGIRFRRLRRLLLEGDTDQLSTLARLRLEGYDVSVAELAAAVATQAALLAEMDREMPALDACARTLVRPNESSPETVIALADIVDRMLLRLDRIAATSLRPLVNERVAGADTDVAGFGPELDAIAIGESDLALREQLAEMLVEGRLDDTAARLDAYAAAATSGDETLASLAETTGARTRWITAVPDCELRASHALVLEQDRTGLQGHSTVHHRLSRLRALGLGPIAEWIRAHPPEWNRASALILAHLYRGLAEFVFAAHGDRLRDYLGSELDDLRGRLAGSDNLMQDSAAHMLGAKLLRKARPPRGVDRGKKSEYTEMGLIAHEMTLQRSRNSVRDVTRRAGNALLELKPCWMMSPLAVSQYLSRDLQFDLCIIDEASQMLPGSAMGAVLRSKQVVIVGDNNQLPPTDLFSSTAMTQDDEDEDLAEDAESVLEMAGKAFPDSRRLRWHYRSRNSGLIAFSNELIYDDQLVVFPSPWEGRAGTGVRLEFLEEGLYEKSLNHVEAEAVVEAVARFARGDSGRSLGVVAMNVQQRNLINDLLHERAVEDAALRDYQARWETERDGIDALFVKNLENVQGDERDVIFISTVYGPKETGGAVHQHFGPVNGKAGRRRLNVLFTRAREQLVTFTSMRPGDVKADEQGNPGRYMLRRWLEYCASGGVRADAASSEKPGSRLAEHLGARLIERGLEVDYEVGTAGHVVDLAVRHPDWPSGYLCGIDCDGETYYASNSARDRDILRQRVLEGLGWRLYRVWSVNWFNDEEAELERLVAWIDDSLVQATRSLP